jgi:AraC-like DNA-binding protein
MHVSQAGAAPEAGWIESHQLIGCGMHYMHRIGPWQYRRAYHTHLWEWWASMYGQSIFLIDGQQVSISPGSCLCIAPGMVHQQLIERGHVSLGMTSHFLFEGDADPLRKISGQVLTLSALGRSLLRQMVETPPAEGVGYLRWRSLFALLLNDLIHSAPVEPPTTGWMQTLALTVPQGTEWSLTHHVMEYLKDHLDRPAGCMEELCRHLGYSQAHLNKLFKQETGISILEAHQRLRLEEAIRLLRTSSFQVKAIAYRLGFTRTHKFNAFFRSRMNCTPTQFLQRENQPGWQMHPQHKHPLADECPV